MKKIIALMIVVLVVTLTGCSEVEDKSSDISEFVIVEITNSLNMMIIDLKVPCRCWEGERSV